MKEARKEVNPTRFNGAVLRTVVTREEKTVVEVIIIVITGSSQEWSRDVKEHCAATFFGVLNVPTMPLEHPPRGGGSQAPIFWPN